MYKKYFAIFLLSSFISVPAFAQDAVFSNSETEQFNLQPLNYSSVPVVSSSEITSKSSSTSAVSVSKDSPVSNKNFLSAIDNLDNAQVELREQMASYAALMAQAKTNYQGRKEEYKTYKKQYNSVKKKMRSVEKSKKLIQGNVYVQNTSRNN